MDPIDFILHIDDHLANLISIFGPWIYALLFVIVFAETGLVFTPFLPGDSLLFAVGALAGSEFLDVWIVYALMLIAAILGDTVNYWIGNKFGSKILAKRNSKFLNQSHIDKTHKFYEKHGGKTIILARFVPIVRTFAPFVAGIGKMNYSTFISYNVIGGFIWVTSFIFTGYFFGSLPFVKKHFELITIGIVLFSIAPMLFEFLRHKYRSK